MHPDIMRQLTAGHIGEMHAKAEDQRRARRARRARRRAPSPPPGPPAGGTLSYDDPRLDTGQRQAVPEQPSAPPLPVMAGSPSDSGDATARRETLDHRR